MRPPRGAGLRAPDAGGGVLTAPRAIGRGARWLGWGLLWGAATLGLLLSAAAFLAALPATRSWVASTIVGRIDDAIAGSLTLEGISVLPHGGVELRGLLVTDPGGRPVLRIDHARLFPDLRGLADREVGISLELDGVDADAALRTAGGALAIAEAFAPASAPARPPGGPEPLREPPSASRDGVGWAIRLGRLTAVRVRVRADGPEGRPLELREVELDARGRWAPRAAWIEARLAGAMASPADAPLTVQLRAARRGDAVELGWLAVGLGDDQLEAVGEGDLARRTGRLALTRVGLSQQEAGSLASTIRLGGSLNGTIYAESDGATATAAFTVFPAAAEATGRAQVAIAARLPPAALAWGVSADVDRLDPSRLSLLAPPGSVTLRGSGAARGLRLTELEGRINLQVARSRLRRGEVGPIALSAAAGGGDVEIAKLEATAPGGEVGGRLRWREGKEVEGELNVRFADLGRFSRNLGELIGRTLPPVDGSGRAELLLSGSSGAPRIEATVEAPRLSIAALRTEGARLRIALEGADAGLTFAANVPDLGPDPVRAELRGRFGDGRRTFDLAELTVAWPGTRFALARPATLELAGPSVDRLLLASGEQRIEAAGGIRRDGAVEGQLRLAGLELSRLPRGLVPEEAALEGQLTVDARASGTRAAPRIDATVGLTGASAWEVGGLSVLGELAWDGELDRIEADLGLVRARGGAIDLSFDLPVALGRARGYEEIRIELRGRELPLDELVWLAGSYELISGDVEVTSLITGSVAAPVLHATAQVRNGTWEDLEELDADGSLDAEGDRLRLRASGALSGAPAVSAEGELALVPGRFLSAPREAIAAARRASGTLALRLPGVSLKPLAGKLHLPVDLGGRLEGEANLGGGLAAPRGTASLAVTGGSGWGARAVAGRITTAFAPERSGATLDLQLAGKPAARLDARIDLPVERLRDAAARAAAPFRLDAALPRSDLAAWGGELIALGGTVEGRGTAQGTLGAPTVAFTLSAAEAVVEARPLGALALDAKYAAGRSTADVNLKPPAGGALRATLALDRDLGILAEPGPIRSSKAQARLVAERLDLGFLPALAPGIVRAASGAASVELSAEGPLGELRPVGTIRLAKGRLAVAELGEWTGATLEADLGPDVVELRKFEVKKGRGRLELRGKLTGLARRGEPAELEATLRAVDFGVERAGMELVRLDLEAEGRGKVTRDELTLGIVTPQGEVRLPRRIPRTLQEVSKRGDITVGRPKPARARRLPRGAGAEVAASEAPVEEPFKTVVHFVAPRRLRVKADQPRIDVELKADALFAFAGNRSEANGSIESVRGQVEPIGGRVFVLERGKVAFTGGPVMAGILDIAARYDNPTAVVRATVAGTLANPRLQLSSEPPLEEAQIALLVATGRTELKAGAGGVNTLAAGDAGLAAAGAIAMGVFKDLLSDKLPVDSVSLDSTAVSAGKYLTDRIYVGYVRRFDARPENGENPDEVRVEYQLAPGWQVETRYGSAQSGGASIVWTRNY